MHTKCSFNVPGTEGTSSQIVNRLKVKLARLKAQGYEWFSLEMKGEASKRPPPSRTRPPEKGHTSASKRRPRSQARPSERR